MKKCYNDKCLPIDSLWYWYPEIFIELICLISSGGYFCCGRRMWRCIPLESLSLTLSPNLPSFIPFLWSSSFLAAWATQTPRVRKLWERWQNLRIGRAFRSYPVRLSQFADGETQGRRTRSDLAEAKQHYRGQVLFLPSQDCPSGPHKFNFSSKGDHLGHHHSSLFPLLL